METLQNEKESSLTARKTKNGKKIGRPLRVFSDEQMTEMQRLAFNGCQNNTIASIMDIPIDTLEARFKKLLTKKRCERKFKLRRQQNEAAENLVPSVLIFLGKNDLGQTDKNETKHSGQIDLKPITIK